jgi:membrane protease YdiL (CAAX protease family)
MTRKILIALSPLFVIAVGFTTALFFSSVIGVWAFVPLALVYWALALLIPLLLGKTDLKPMFARPTGIVLWPILSLVVGLIPLPILLLNLPLLGSSGIGIVVLWIAFALVNPFFEEIYWRGFLLEALPFKWKWLRAVYSSVLFIASHPLMWGVFSIANRSWMLLVSLAVMSAVWSLVRYKSKSIWWTVISHILVDIFNIAVFVFLNLYTAGPPPA